MKRDQMLAQKVVEAKKTVQTAETRVQKAGQNAKNLQSAEKARVQAAVQVDQEHARRSQNQEALAAAVNAEIEQDADRLANKADFMFDAAGEALADAAVARVKSDAMNGPREDNPLFWEADQNAQEEVASKSSSKEDYHSPENSSPRPSAPEMDEAQLAEHEAAAEMAEHAEAEDEPVRQNSVKTETEDESEAQPAAEAETEAEADADEQPESDAEAQEADADDKAEAESEARAEDEKAHA